MDGKSPRQLHPTVHHTHQQKDDDDYKAASENLNEAVDYRQFMPKLKAEHKILRRIIKTVLLVVVVAGLGYGAYYAGSHYGSTSKKPAKKTSTVTTSKAVIPTQAYTSANQNLTFNYPTNWKVNETTTVITATSPMLKLTSYSHQSVDGQVTLQIRAQGVALSEFNAGDATAILPSQIITYTSPANGQRASTYISFLNYASSKGSGIDGIYITGNTGYQSGQDAPESEIQAVDPVISLSFAKCTDKACNNTTPLTISTGSWGNKAFSGPLLTMLESLSIS